MSVAYSRSQGEDYHVGVKRKTKTTETYSKIMCKTLISHLQSSGKKLFL